jgi:hypothetical protein
VAEFLNEQPSQSVNGVVGRIYDQVGQFPYFIEGRPF